MRQRSAKSITWVWLGVAALWCGPLPARGDLGRVTGLCASNGTCRLAISTASNATYQLQQLDALDARWWNDKGAAAAGSGSSMTQSCAASASCGFFRVLAFTNSVFWYDWAYRTQNPLLATWGLGATQGSYTHVDRPLEWYIDQALTGASSNANCGPSSVTMAIKWYDATFAHTAEEARNWSSSWRGTGWWYTTDIDSYLTLYGVPHVTSAFTGTNQLSSLLGEGKLIVLCISTAYLTQNANAEQRTGRFYSYASGHFLVVKGVRSTAGNMFFEVYDPNNWGALYADGTPKGRNRHLKASELAAAIQNWWNYLIVVTPPAGGGGAARPESAWIEPVDPAKIPSAWGM